MPEPRRAVTVTGTSTTARMSLLDLRQDYVWRRDGTEPGPSEPSPAEIVAALHQRIAAKSPAHAALVAAFEAQQPPRRERSYGLASHNAQRTAERDDRMRRYAALRASGLSKRQARTELGFSRWAADQYEADMHLVRAEAGS